MNSILLLSNAIALTVLLGGYFTHENGAEQVAHRMPHYLQLQKAPQLAFTNDQRGFVGQDVNQHDYPLVSQSSERLVF